MKMKSKAGYLSHSAAGTNRMVFLYALYLTLGNFEKLLNVMCV